MRNNLGQFLKGYLPPTAIKKGEHRGLATQFKKGFKLSEETKAKMRGRVSPMKGKKHSGIAKEKNRLKHLGKKSYWKGKVNINSRGKNSNFWKGGITPLRKLIRGCFKNRQWISDVFTRDDFTCVNCGLRGGVLNAHHIKSFSDILEDYNISSYEESLSCEELWNINNGVTLCEKCHHSS